MLPFFYYFLKVIICSGILYSYYLTALRNKRFHQYNRFYLLSSVALSFVIPLLKIELWKETVQVSPVTTVITFVNQADAYVAKNTFTFWEWDNLFFVAITIVSVIFLVSLVVSLRKIFVLIRKHPKKFWEDICFVFTNSPGTPFSFFKYIFWNSEIDIESEAGRHILKHELAHVKEKHTLDKIFLSTALIIGWYNPFLWLIKKELSIIHEFIADQKAVSDGDANSFAIMLLHSAYPASSFTLANSFFHSPIKRRLLMLTSSKNTSFSYLRRVAVLPLLFVASVLFAFTIKEVKTRVITHASKGDNTTANKQTSLVQKEFDTYESLVDTSFKIKQDNKVPAKSDKVSVTTASNQIEVVVKAGAAKDTLKVSKALVLLDGKIITQEEMKDIKPSQIKSINVLKGQSATDKYGDEGKNGVIEITSLPVNEQRAQQQQYVREQQNFNNQQEKQKHEQSTYYVTGTNLENTSPAILPQFPGGLQGWRHYILRNANLSILADHKAPIGNYPVVITFDVNTDGSITNIAGESNIGYGTEEEAIKLVSKGPKWEPAKKDGVPVVSHVKQTITFMLTKDGALVTVDNIAIGTN
jgi:beta-lactamase regulating signal transducer with metallopeptidase domain